MSAECLISLTASGYDWQAAPHISSRHRKWVLWGKQQGGARIPARSAIRHRQSLIVPLRRKPCCDLIQGLCWLLYWLQVIHEDWNLSAAKLKLWTASLFHFTWSVFGNGGTQATKMSSLGGKQNVWGSNRLVIAPYCLFSVSACRQPVSWPSFT